MHPDLSGTIRSGEGRVGIMMSHGFTGSTGSIRGWAEALAALPDTRVLAPRLAGHGTRWEDMAQVSWREWELDVLAAYDELAQHCRQVFVAGLSMGGALALRVAQLREVAGVMLVNPAIATQSTAINNVGLLRHLVKSQPGIASDIAQPGVVEPGYDRVSIPAVWQMTQLWERVRADLELVRAPVLLMRSTTDHVVDTVSGDLMLERLAQIEEIKLTNSYHVATLDYDAELINTASGDFVERLR